MVTQACFLLHTTRLGHQQARGPVVVSSYLCRRNDLEWTCRGSVVNSAQVGCRSQHAARSMALGGTSSTVQPSPYCNTLREEAAGKTESGRFLKEGLNSCASPNSQLPKGPVPIQYKLQVQGRRAAAPRIHLPRP